MKREHAKKYILNYGCDCHEIDARTLSVSLETLNEVVEEINGQLHTTKKIELKVKALNDGSFEVNLEIVQLSEEDAISIDSISHIARIINLINEIIELSIFLNEKPPNKVDISDKMVHITNTENMVYTISKEAYDLFEKNDNLPDLIRKHFIMLNDDEKITSFTILDDSNKPIVNIKKESFRKVAVARLLQKEEKTLTDVAHLIVFKVVFGKKYKWAFIYKGHKISATITDEEFYKKIDQGERFAQGDVLLTDVKITQRFNKIINAYINEGYEITKVIKHIPREEQTKLHLG